MSEVFEGYERQYCEASASLTRKCTAAAALQGGNLFSLNLSVSGRNLWRIRLGIVLFYLDWML
jgi:hypothetical protein